MWHRETLFVALARAAGAGRMKWIAKQAESTAARRDDSGSNIDGAGLDRCWS